MRLSFVDMAALPEAGVEGSTNGMGAKSAPDDGFVSVLRDISDGAGQAGRLSEIDKKTSAPSSGEEQAPAYIDGSLDGAAELMEGETNPPKDGEEDEVPAACLSAAMPMQCAAAASMAATIEEASDDERAIHGKSPMTVNQSLLAANRLIEDRIGMPDDYVIRAGEAVAPSADESIAGPEIETTGLDAPSFKDAGAGAPDMPPAPETLLSPDALSSPASHAGDAKAVAEADESTAGGLQRKAVDAPTKDDGQGAGLHQYGLNLSGMGSANGSGHNPEGGDAGRDRDGAAGDPSGASVAGAPAFSLHKEGGVQGKGPVFGAGQGAGPSGAEGIYRRIEDAVSSIRSKAVSTIRLRLHPENMGEMSLRVTGSDSAASAHITVTNPAVKEMLDADSSRLRDIFLAEGLVLDKCSVELSSNFSSSDPRGFVWAWDANGHGGRAASATQFVPAADRGNGNGLPLARGPFPDGRGGIDVFA